MFLKFIGAAHVWVVCSLLSTIHCINSNTIMLWHNLDFEPSSGLGIWWAISIWKLSALQVWENFLNYFIDDFLLDLLCSFFAMSIIYRCCPQTSSKFLTFPIPFLNFFSYCSMLWYISSVSVYKPSVMVFHFCKSYTYISFEIRISKFIFQLLCDICSFFLNIIFLFHDNIFSY